MAAARVARVTGKWQTKHKEGLKEPSSKCQQQSSGRSMRVNLLFVVSFLMVYGFSSESLYAVFMKEKLGHGEKEMSQLLMVNGLASAMAQVFVLPRVQDRKLGTLMSCTIIFTLGMIGIGAIHSPALHYIIFTVHLVAYMLADTTVASLLTEFSPPHAQVYINLPNPNPDPDANPNANPNPTEPEPEPEPTGIESVH